MVGDVHSSLLLGRVLRIRLGGKLGRLMVQILLSRQVVVVETSIAWLMVKGLVTLSGLDIVERLELEIGSEKVLNWLLLLLQLAR